MGEACTDMKAAICFLALTACIRCGASAGPLPMVQPVPPPVKMHISTPFDVLEHSVLEAAGSTPDTILSAVKKSNGEYNFWTGSRTPWAKIGSQGGEVKATKILGNVTVKGYPCPKGYSNPCLLEHTAATNVGMWPANVYQISDDEILVFIHLEFRWHGKWNIRHGLAYSRDGGSNFQWLDYIIAPAGPCGTGLTTVSGECPNMGLTNYIIKDGFFQLYYHDSLKPESPTGTGGAVAVARAAVADVVAAARRQKASPWFKYYNMEWSEPALGGQYTPLNIPVQGYMHGDAIYIEVIKQYAILVESGDRGRDAKDWRRAAVISFSVDGIQWSNWQTVYSGDAGAIMYPSLMSYGPDNEVAGRTFAAVYDYSPCSPRRKCAAFKAVNITVTDPYV